VGDATNSGIAEQPESYARGGHGARLGAGLRPACLIVDLEYGFTDPTAPLGSDLDDVVSATRQLADDARAAAVPVIFTTIAFTPGLGDAGTWPEKVAGLRSLVDGSHYVEIDARLGRTEDEPLIVKKGASAFFGTNLVALLAPHGVDTLVICGATTSGCIRASVVDAIQHAYRPLVPRECVGDRAPAPHLAALFDIDNKYGDVIGLDDARSVLRRSRDGA
jgi:maleamate amidohydrolase